MDFTPSRNVDTGDMRVTSVFSSSPSSWLFSKLKTLDGDHARAFILSIPNRRFLKEITEIGAGIYSAHQFVRAKYGDVFVGDTKRTCKAKNPEKLAMWARQLAAEKSRRALSGSNTDTNTSINIGHPRGFHSVLGAC